MKCRHSEGERCCLSATTCPQIAKLCPRTLLFKEGSISMHGPTAPVIAHYLALNHSRSQSPPPTPAGQPPEDRARSNRSPRGSGGFFFGHALDRLDPNTNQAAVSKSSSRTGSGLRLASANQACWIRGKSSGFRKATIRSAANSTCHPWQRVRYHATIQIAKPGWPSSIRWTLRSGLK